MLATKTIMVKVKTADENVITDLIMILEENPKSTFRDLMIRLPDTTDTNLV